MTGRSRRFLAALGAIAAAVAICLVLPATSPACAMPSNLARESGTCPLGQMELWRQVAIAILAVGSAATLLFLGSVGRQAALHYGVSRGLRHRSRPARLADHRVALVPGRGRALVAGIRQPRIYCSEDLAVILDADELRAVLLHEHHHELSHAPARLIVLSALAPLLRPLPLGTAWLERQRARIEIAADEHAIRRGVDRATLARAILKLHDGAPIAALAWFASATDLRLRALLGEDESADRMRLLPLRTAIGPAAMAVAVICALVSLL